MMPMAGLSDDVGRMSGGVEQASKNIDRGHDFHGAIDRGPADTRQFLYEVLGGERTGLPQNGFDHIPPGAGGAIAVRGKDRQCIGSGHWIDRRCHDR